MLSRRKTRQIPALCCAGLFWWGRPEGLPQAMTAWIKESGIGWVEFLLVVNLLLAGK
jgi:hypothetical protein